MVKSQKKKFNGIFFFEINIFGLKYVLKHSESIWKKNFFENFFFQNVHFWSYFPHFLSFLTIFDIFFAKKMKKKIVRRFNGFNTVIFHYRTLPYDFWALQAR